MFFFFFQAEDGIRDIGVTGVQTCALPIYETALEPYDIFLIADGQKPGNREAAQKAFAEMGEMAGDAIATALTLIDGIVVIGGGLAGAAKYILPALVKELNGTIGTFGGDSFPRMRSE